MELMEDLIKNISYQKQNLMQWTKRLNYLFLY